MDEKMHNKNLIINYLPQSLSDKEFHSIFVTIGAIRQYKLMRDPKTGYSYGYGFVDYVNPDDADKAIDQLNGLNVQNKRLKVAFARPYGQDLKNTNVYVQNLPRDIDDGYMERLFAPFGEIVQTRLLRDKYTGLLRGVGFVRFAKNEQALRAIDQLNNIVPEGGTVALNVKLAENHAKKNQQKYMTTNSAGAMSDGVMGVRPMGPMQGFGVMGNMAAMGNMRPMGPMTNMGGMGPMGGMDPMGSMGNMGGMGPMGSMGNMGGMGAMGGNMGAMAGSMGAMGGSMGAMGMMGGMTPMSGMSNMAGGGAGAGSNGMTMGSPAYGAGRMSGADMGLAGAAPGATEPLMGGYRGSAGADRAGGPAPQLGHGYNGQNNNNGNGTQRNSWQKVSTFRPKTRFNPMGRSD